MYIRIKYREVPGFWQAGNTPQPVGPALIPDPTLKRLFSYLPAFPKLDLDIMSNRRVIGPLFLCLSMLIAPAVSGQVIPAPERTEGEGPYNRLVLRGGILIDGTGAPPVGPVDIVVEQDRIVRVTAVGYPGGTAGNLYNNNRPEAGDKEIDVSGMYILPGFVDMHGHTGGRSQGTPAEYVLKLWMAHGITTVREPGSGNGIDWTIEHREKSEAGKITAPRFFVYARFGTGWDRRIVTPEDARDWVRFCQGQGRRRHQVWRCSS